MAREGLRTLVVAKKSLTEEQYQDFEVWKDKMINIISIAVVFCLI